MSLKSFLATDPRLTAAEFAARIYPDKPRRTATILVNRALNKPGDELPEALTAAAQQQVQQLATDIVAGLRRPEGRQPVGADAGLVALAGDPRLRQDALAPAIYPTAATNTALAYWKAARKGERELTASERATLRTELQALAAACQRAVK